MKKFAFLIQARADSDYFKKFQSDDSDCYTLFFKTEINRERTFFRPNTTWTEGRNILLQEAFGQQDYEYYVFLDDDVRIINQFYNSCGIENFKKYLLKYQPAVGYTEYKNDYSKKKKFMDTYLPFHYRGRQFTTYLLNLLFPKFRKGTSRIGYFDACANAIHKDAIKLLLPYEDKFDAISWYWSQEIFCHVTKQVCFESTLQFDSLMSLNLQSDPYPKDSDYNELNRSFTEYLASALKDKGLNNTLYPENRKELFTTGYKSVSQINLDYQSRIKELFHSDHLYILKKEKFWRELMKDKA